MDETDISGGISVGSVQETMSDLYPVNDIETSLIPVTPFYLEKGPISDTILDNWHKYLQLVWRKEFIIFCSTFGSDFGVMCLMLSLMFALNKICEPV